MFLLNCTTGLPMISGLYFFFILIVLVIIIAIVWRLASRQHSIPCPVWMSGMLDTPFSRGLSKRTQKTIQRLDLKPGMKVLDAGCGPGRLTLPIAMNVGPSGEVTAIDIQEGMLSHAQERARKANLANIRFLRTSLGMGTLEGNYFDRAVMVTVLGEIPDREAAVRELFEALMPGGFLLVEETIRDPHFQSYRTVTSLAGAAGFREKDFFGTWFSYTLALEKPS
jgi:SAM-dependent methyltransferase